MISNLSKRFLLAVTLIEVTCSTVARTDEKLFHPKTPTLLLAEQLRNDRNEGVTIAEGAVEVEHGGRVLQADRVIYNEKTNKVKAQGNVRIFELNGEIIFVDEAELSGDLKEGLIKEIKVILTDDSKMIAALAKREGGKKSTFDQAIYSPCKVCKATPYKPPLWQIKAQRVVWDEQTEDITYTDAFMEFKGVPIFYTPYLRHPAPTVKRRSGILSPFFGGAASYGMLIGVPYFWAIAQDKDITITPMMVGSRPMLGLEYRQRFTKGRFMLGGSMTNASRVSGTNKNPKTENNTFRGHIIGDGLLELDQNWRAVFQLERASDSSYLKKYSHLNMASKNVLITKGYLEGFWNRSYATAQAYTFQGLREVDSSATTPIIFPKADFNYISQPGRWGGVWTFDGNVLALSRREGTDMQRLSTIGGYYVPYHSAWGHVCTTGFKVRSDYYHVTDHRPTANDSTLEGSRGRAFAQAYSNIDWPFIRIAESTRFIIEPRIGLVASPNVGVPLKLPNEDSRITELNDLNMMSESRFAGLDRIDGGTRVNYGLNLAAYTQNYGNADAFFGQSMALHQPREYLRDTGMDKKLSDYVGRLKFTYTDWLTLHTRVLLDRSRFKSRRIEFTGLFGKPILQAGVDYILLPRIASDPFDKKGEQIRLTLSSKFTENWSAIIGSTRELGKGGGMLSQEAGIQYEDECFTVNTTVQKTFYKDRDLVPGITVMLRFIFKNLGDFQQGTNLTS
jgi:LPS-assembly protein